MVRDCRSRIVTALAGVLIAMPAWAQETQPESTTVGPPQLREFQLPPSRTPQTTQPTTTQGSSSAAPAPATPPATTPAPEPPADQPSAAPSAVPVISVPPPVMSETVPEGESTSPPAAAGPANGTTAHQASPAVAAPAPASGTAPGSVSPTATAPPASPPETVQPAPQGPGTGGIPWILIALGLAALAIIAGLVVFRKLRTSRDAEESFGEQIAAEEVPAAAPLRAPAPLQRAPGPAAAPILPITTTSSGDVVGVQIRPWLSLEFRPAQAAATLTEAVVQFELQVRNVGNVPARNIRIETRMFNAGAQQDAEIAGFFAKPVDEKRSARILAIPARNGARLRSSVSMPKEEVREINVEGRRLFIPMVAINVVYEWGEGRKGQTSMSYLVGREPETPSAKMGAFRLDLGPRIYRSVGQRPSDLTVLV